MAHTSERVDQVFQLIITLDTIFIAFVSTTPDRQRILLTFLVGAIVSWSAGYISEIDRGKLMGWTLLANTTCIYWLFSYWSDFMQYVGLMSGLLGLDVTLMAQLTVWAILFLSVGAIWFTLRRHLYCSVRRWTIALVLGLTLLSSFALVHS